jgi:hypothetical protein
MSVNACQSSLSDRHAQLHHNAMCTGACAIVTENSILNGKGAGVVVLSSL